MGWNGMGWVDKGFENKYDFQLKLYSTKRVNSTFSFV